MISRATVVVEFDDYVGVFAGEITEANQQMGTIEGPDGSGIALRPIANLADQAIVLRFDGTKQAGLTWTKKGEPIRGPEPVT